MRDEVADMSKYEMEIEVLQKYTHPNIVQYVGVQVENRNLHIFLEVRPSAGLRGAAVVVPKHHMVAKAR